ncbi:MAG: YggT family protein [Alphaproteobacteria bacterium]|nr:YggT family protein [Alphaproteobacteria bacterium]
MNFLYPFFWLLHTGLDIYKWIVIIAAVVSLLIAFRVLDTRNRLVWTIADFLYRITEPALRPIRRFMPDLGGIDISPVVLILLLQFSQMLLSAAYLWLVRAIA